MGLWPETPTLSTHPQPGERPRADPCPYIEASMKPPPRGSEDHSLVDAPACQRSDDAPPNTKGAEALPSRALWTL